MMCRRQDGIDNWTPTVDGGCVAVSGRRPPPRRESCRVRKRRRVGRMTDEQWRAFSRTSDGGGRLC